MGDLMPLGKELCAKAGFPLEIVALQAPQMHPQGLGRQWYGLYPSNWEEVPQAVNELQARLVSLSTPQIPLERTALLGFSQGGAMALASGCEMPLAGLIACSGYPHPDWICPASCPPVLLAHGLKDEVVPYAASEKLLSSLKANNIQSELLTFDAGHLIPTELIPPITEAVQKWLR